MFHRISSNNSRGRLFHFSQHKGAIIQRKAIDIRGRRLFQIFLTRSSALNICSIIPLNQKIITSNQLNMGFLSVSNFSGSLINFQSLNRHWSLLLDQIPLQLDREGIKEREDDERGGEGGGRLFREAINRGTAIIRGNTVVQVDKKKRKEKKLSETFSPLAFCQWEVIWFIATTKNVPCRMWRASSPLPSSEWPGRQSSLLAMAGFSSCKWKSYLWRIPDQRWLDRNCGTLCL